MCDARLWAFLASWFWLLFLSSYTIELSRSTCFLIVSRLHFFLSVVGGRNSHDLPHKHTSSKFACIVYSLNLLRCHTFHIGDKKITWPQSNSIFTKITAIIFRCRHDFMVFIIIENKWDGLYFLPTMNIILCGIHKLHLQSHACVKGGKYYCDHN